MIRSPETDKVSWLKAKSTVARPLSGASDLRAAVGNPGTVARPLSMVSDLRQALTASEAPPAAPVNAPLYVTTASTQGFAAATAVGTLTGVQAGDVLVAFGSGNDQTATLTPPAGAGWAAIGDSGTAVGGAAGRLWVYATVATGSNPSGGTWTWPSTHNHWVGIVAYRYVQLPSTAATAKAASASAVTAPSVTNVRAGALLLVGSEFVTNGTSPAWTAGITTRMAAAGTSNSGIIGDSVLSTAGPSGTRQFTVTGVSAALSAAALVLEPST